MHLRPLFRRREHFLAVGFLVRLQSPGQTAVQAHNLAILQVAADDRHDAFAMRFAVLPLLVRGDVGGHRAVHANHGCHVEIGFLFDRDVGLGGARGQ